VQVNYVLPSCLQSYITNAGRVRSKGFDVQGQARLGRGLIVSGQLAYTDARHVEPLMSGAAVLIRKDDRLPAPRWSYTLGIEYSFPALNRFPSYARIDYQYTGPYLNGFGPGAFTYAPDIYHMDATHHLSARVGVAIDRLELALFVNNLLNSRDLLSKNGGRSGCRDVACSSFSTNVPIMEYTTFTPRTVGLSLSYRY
jgi:iron complex outermembrane recepter protein